MNEESFTRNIEIAASPAQVFRALTSEVRMWWTTSADDASVVGKSATFRFDESYQTMIVKDLVPERRVVWDCVEQVHANKTLSVHDEWVGTRLIWKIEPASRGCRLTFIHQGLVPQLECYEICEGGWDHYVESLKSYLETGTGDPYRHSAKPGARGDRS
jgi:uncharacterized protein YndB with AHSA1/START domain